MLWKVSKKPLLYKREGFLTTVVVLRLNFVPDGVCVMNANNLLFFLLCCCSHSHSCSRSSSCFRWLLFAQVRNKLVHQYGYNELGQLGREQFAKKVDTIVDALLGGSTGRSTHSRTGETESECVVM